MWHITAPTPQARAGHPIAAPAPLACTGCEHAFAPGSLVLSDAPEALPPRVSRAQLRHFHLACEECESGNVSCYQTYASRQPTHVAEEEVNCACCEEAVWLRQRFASDYVLLPRGEDDAPGIASHATVPLLGRTATPFEKLSRKTRQRFMRAGAQRLNATKAKALYNRMPWATRVQGEPAILHAMDGKNFSHIKSVSNHPDLATSPKNIIPENATKNLSRGAKNMSKPDLLSAQAKNWLSANRGLAAKSALLGALLEAPISAAENSIRVRRGVISKEEAARNIGRDTAGVALSGGATVVVLPILAPAIAPIAPAIAVVGTGLLAARAAQRLRCALPESPLTPLVLYFHPDCYSRYAGEVSAPPTDPGESELSALDQLSPRSPYPRPVDLAE